jgi:hypothetical protein
VTNTNKLEYLMLLARYKLRSSVEIQIRSFLDGLLMLVPEELLAMFDDNELELLCCGLPKIDVHDLQAHTNCSISKCQADWLWTVVEEFSQEVRRWQCF